MFIEKFQPPEQAGFRKKFSTTDHIHTLNLIIEKYLEHNKPLYLAFIDYAKAFDSILHKSIWKALHECEIPSETIDLIKDIYYKSKSRVKLERQGPEINISRGVRQGDPLSPIIFIAVLQSIMKTLNWEKKGININGKLLSNLRFADDIILFSESASQLQKMIIELNDVSNMIGLELNASKTKIMTNHQTIPIKVNNNTLQYVQSYVYLGQQVSFSKTRHEDEVKRRVNITWNKFWSNKETLKSELPLKLKKKIMDSCLLTCLTYGCQTWIYNNYTKNKIQVCQRAMERSLLNIQRQHRKRNTEIRKITKIIDALEYSQKQKWNWAGHVARMDKEKWTTRVTTWQGPTNKRLRGRPKEKWIDEIKRKAGENWITKAKDRQMWSKMEEAFTRRGVHNDF